MLIDVSLLEKLFLMYLPYTTHMRKVSNERYANDSIRPFAVPLKAPGLQRLSDSV